MILLYYISIGFFIAYITILLAKFGIPASISESSYLYGKNGNLIFFGCFLTFIFPMMIYWIQISEGMWYQFMAFLSCAALCFTAITGRYRGSDKTEWAVHTYGTIACAVFAQLWMWFTISSSWILSLLLLISAFVAGMAIRGAKREIWEDVSGKTVYGTIKKRDNSIVFFVEMALFLMAYLAIFIYIKKL